MSQAETQPKYGGKDAATLTQAMQMRMRGPLQFQHWHPVYVSSGDKVVVFIIHNGEATYLEDPYELYPSDALITKLRLML